MTCQFHSEAIADSGNQKVDQFEAKHVASQAKCLAWKVCHPFSAACLQSFVANLGVHEAMQFVAPSCKVILVRTVSRRMDQSTVALTFAAWQTAAALDPKDELALRFLFNPSRGHSKPVTWMRL